MMQVLDRHEVIGLDADGVLCSCGSSSTSELEHLGEVALFLLDPDLLAPHCKCGRVSDGECRRCAAASRLRQAREDVRWLLGQKRLMNYASFQHQSAFYNN